MIRKIKVNKNSFLTKNIRVLPKRANSRGTGPKMNNRRIA